MYVDVPYGQRVDDCDRCSRWGRVLSSTLTPAELSDLESGQEQEVCS